MKNRTLLVSFALLGGAWAGQSCEFSNSNDDMVRLLAEIRQTNTVKENPFAPEAEFAFLDSVSIHDPGPSVQMRANFFKANSLLKLGKEPEALSVLEDLEVRTRYSNESPFELLKSLALTYLRHGERQNCVANHSTESCLLPIRNGGIHRNSLGSRKAIALYEYVLKNNPNDYESRWLLNIAYMTLGAYPANVPPAWLIPNLDHDDSGEHIRPFVDVAPELGLNQRNMAGGVVTDDFNNDGYLDIVTSDWGLDGSMHYFKNDTKGGFVDVSDPSQLGRFKGGLNIIQADYDNDGDLDLFVLRGAWMENFGQQPNSLLRNNGDDTFTDVTVASGLFSRHPTQAGVWRDFNNDGWLDLFIGNENAERNFGQHPCELYLSDRDGTFTEVAAVAGCRLVDYVKGVTAGDYDNDGRQDLFLSGIRGKRTLLKNVGSKDGVPQFTDVTKAAGLRDVVVSTFPTWFWDYDNDGYLDIFVSGYQFDQSVAYTAATEALGMPNTAGKMYLYHNNHDGTFRNASVAAGLNKSVFTMGSNFGDIDNDGYLDMYLGTGNPDYKSLVPNRLFRNRGDGRFADVTISGRVGNLQKGHGVSITDLDNDGDQDIFIEVGGAYVGDSYTNSLYLNPGQNTNHWINLRLEGTQTNRSALGTRLKVSFTENGIKRVVYRDVNSGGSFGSSSFRREIGIGQATFIDEIAITWGGTGKPQVFRNIRPNQFLRIKQGDAAFSRAGIKKTPFRIGAKGFAICYPQTI